VGATPLIRGYGADATFAWRNGAAIPVQAFLQDAAQLATRLPERRHVINLCADRYRFAVGFAAALLRQQVSLLPPNETLDVISRVAQGYPDVYCLSDRGGDFPHAPLENMRFVSFAEGRRPPVAVPSVPDEQVAAVVFTSGSTGQPVPHPKTWGNLARVARSELDGLNLRSLPGLVLLATVL